jgi:hypothetical protein
MAGGGELLCSHASRARGQALELWGIYEGGWSPANLNSQLTQAPHLLGD